MDDLDSAMDVVNAYEEKRSRNNQPRETSGGKVLIGSVEQFFGKISVAAIKLNGTLRVGDIIEIGNEEEAIRQRVSSMQIDKEEVEEAQDGESVGIKTIHPVSEGSTVYKIER